MTSLAATPATGRAVGFARSFATEEKMDENNKRQGGPDVCPGKRKQLDLQTGKEQIEETSGPEHWRSLEELAGSEKFRGIMYREDPMDASERLQSSFRRRCLQTI